MRLLLQLLKKQKGFVSLTLILSFLSICVLLWWNLQLSGIINTVNASGAVSGKTILLAGAAALLSAGTAYGLSMCSGWTVETMTHDLRMLYAESFTRLSYPQIEHLSAGEQISKLQNEIDDVSVFLQANLFSLVDDVVRFIASFALMLWLNPSLTLLSSLPVVFLMWYTAFASKLIGKTAQKSQQANQEMTGFADTLVAVFPVLKLFDAAALMRRQYGQRLQNFEASTIREERRRALLMTISGFLSGVPLMLLFLLGGIQIINGTEQVGTLYIFLNLSGNVSGFMMNMAGRMAEFRRFSVNMDRLEPTIFGEPKEAES